MSRRYRRGVFVLLIMGLLTAAGAMAQPPGVSATITGGGGGGGGSIIAGQPFQFDIHVVNAAPELVGLLIKSLVLVAVGLADSPWRIRVTRRPCITCT